MADIPLGPWKIGIDHLSPKASSPDGAARDAVNVDFDRDGGAARRAGYSLLQAVTHAHSIWTSSAEQSFCVIGNSLCAVDYTDEVWTTQAIASLTSGLAMSYDEINGDVICTNHAELLRVRPDLTVEPLALPRPDAPPLVATSHGGLYAGRYAVAVSLLRNEEEGPLSMSSFVDVPEGGGLQVTTPAHSDNVRIYRTQANGGELYAATVAPPGMSYLVGTGDVGRVADAQYLDALPPGQFIRYWRGLALVARGRTLFWSEPMRYGVFDPRHNFVQMANRITLVEPVRGGVFVGTKDGVVFLSGNSPAEWSIKNTDGRPPVDGTGVRVPGSVVGAEVGDDIVAVWLADNGFVIGAPDGTLQQAQSKRIRLPGSQVAAGVGAAVVHDRQIIAAIN